MLAILPCIMLSLRLRNMLFHPSLTKIFGQGSNRAERSQWSFCTLTMIALLVLFGYNH